MPTKPKSIARKLGAADTTAAVNAFMAELDHPHKSEVQALRKIILGADPSIAEGIKWNAPSYRTTEYFATTHLRAKKGVGLILHLGAKVRDQASLRIEDADQMLEWLGKDRAMITFDGMKAVKAGEASLRRIIRQWIQSV